MAAGASGFVAGVALTCILFGGGAPPAGTPGGQLLGLLAPAPRPTLHYFDIRGRAEAIRMAMADANVPFVDAAFSSEEWGKERPDGLKAKLIRAGKLPFGQVPMLEQGNFSLVQSHSILRYLGRAYGWYAGSAEELGAIDVVADGTEDVRKQVCAPDTAPLISPARASARPLSLSVSSLRLGLDSRPSP
jgi:hypothetical protein